MARVRRINVSQVEGDYSNDSDKRPFGEITLYEDNNGGFDLVIHDGVNSTNLNKVLGKGKFYGHNADSGDGAGYDTIKLIPDIPAYNGGSDQYLIVDPTAPNHIHLRAGGPQDNSGSQLFIGGENSYVSVGSGSNPAIYISANSNVWTFATNGGITFPDSSIQTTAWLGSNKTIQSVTVTTPTVITADVVFADPNAAGGAVNLVLPSAPANGTMVTVKNINAAGNSVYVQTNGTDIMEIENGSLGSGVYATISANGGYITWIYESNTTTYRIIG